ncbi:MAG: FixH family protein [Burkholderiales bacterium]
MSVQMPNTLTAVAEPLEPTRPWYREPWPWLLMAGPAIVVVAGIYTTVLAVQSNDGLVAEDYYKRGMTINRQLAREQVARDAKIFANVAYRDGGFEVEVGASIVLPSRLRLRVIHPTRSGEDKEVILNLRSAGRYFAPHPALTPEARQLILEDVASTWRISGMLDRHSKSARLEPQLE